MSDIKKIKKIKKSSRGRSAVGRHGDGHSSVHADGRLFIVRRSKHEYKKIPPFDETELPTYELTNENNLRVVYPRYKVLTDKSSAPWSKAQGFTS